MLKIVPRLAENAARDSERIPGRGVFGAKRRENPIYFRNQRNIVDFKSIEE